MRHVTILFLLAISAALASCSNDVSRPPKILTKATYDGQFCTRVLGRSLLEAKRRLGVSEVTWLTCHYDNKILTNSLGPVVRLYTSSGHGGGLPCAVYLRGERQSYDRYGEYPISAADRAKCHSWQRQAVATYRAKLSSVRSQSPTRYPLLFLGLGIVLGGLYGYLVSLGYHGGLPIQLPKQRIVFTLVAGATAFILGAFAIQERMNIGVPQTGGERLIAVFVSVPIALIAVAVFFFMLSHIKSFLVGAAKFGHFMVAKHPAEDIVNQARGMQPLDRAAFSKVMREHKIPVDPSETFWKSLFTPKFVDEHLLYRAQQVRKRLDEDTAIIGAALDRERRRDQL